MEESNIRYTGITQASSDLDCPDGDLSISHNIISQNGAMRPIVLPDAAFTLGEGEKLLYVHSASGYKNYIVSTADGKLGFYDQEMQYEAIDSFSGADKIQSVSAVGNTMIAFADSGLHYFLYKDARYEYLGQKPPETVIGFSLSGKSQVLVKSTGSKSGLSLWMIQKNNGDASWSSPVRVSREAEDAHSGDWKTYVFKRGEFHYESGTTFLPGQPSGNNPIPDGWEDVPNGENRPDVWCLCIGTVNYETRNIAWGDVYALNPIVNHESVSFRFASNDNADEAPACDLNAAEPAGWVLDPPDTRSDEETIFTVALTDGISEGDYNLLDSGMLDKIELSDADKNVVSTDILAKVALWVSNATEGNKFVYPFFVRYAYRLYDGSHLMQSCPTLMVPNSLGRPFVLINRLTGKEGRYKEPYYQVVGPQVELEIHSLALGEGLEKWKDIVTGIDIFVSGQFYNYVTNGQIKYVYSTQRYPLGDAYTVSRLNSYSGFGEDMYTYLKMKILSPEALYGTPVLDIEGGSFFIGGLLFELPELEDEQGDYLEKIRSNSQFYLFKSYSIDSEGEDYIAEGLVKSDDNQLKNIYHKETLEDDYLTHDLLKPAYSFVYNQRLNIANVRRELFDGFPAEMQSGYNTNVVGGVELKSNYAIFIFVHAENGRDIVVRSNPGLMLNYFTDYLYYPNRNAYKAVVMRYDDYFSYSAELQLTEHKGLNGAYWFSGFSKEIYYQGTYVQIPTVSADKGIIEPNKIYTSEVGNPFYFPLGGINTIGVGEIVGISSTTRALSQGQFGQFPLLVFATDGIWAMEVSETGLYSAKQPISRDVCSNPQSITQTDGAVVFVSDKGLMVVDGSNVDLLSAELDGPSFDALTVEGLSNVLSKEGLMEEVGSLVPVKDFLSGCRIAYDYPNARLVIFRKGSLYAYVYSLHSRTWATMSADYVTAVTDYPGCYLQRNGGEVVDISTKQDYDSDKSVNTLLLSRPLKLGDDALKTLNVVINRGHILREKGAVVAYASHDGQRYVPIGSAVGHRLSRLQGSPYRYFRLLLVREMDIGQSLSATSVYFTRKWRNKPR